MTTPRYASPVDYDRYGRYGEGRGFDVGRSFRRPVYQFHVASNSFLVVAWPVGSALSAEGGRWTARKRWRH